MIILQEADEIAYRLAFGCQSKGEVTVTEDWIVNSRVDRRIEALHMLETPEGVGAVTDVHLWLSPSNHSNFRYAVATIPGPKGPGYKAGRPAKPYWLAHIRNRLEEQWGARQIEGYEADDALGIYANENTIASHIDKDINMVPGWHHNHVTGEFYQFDEKGWIDYAKDKKKLIGGGWTFFYAQMLMGDATDNIPGIKGVGHKGAYEALKECKNEQEHFDVISKHYLIQYEGMYIDAIKEVADLLWMCQEEDVTGRVYLQQRGFV